MNRKSDSFIHSFKIVIMIAMSGIFCSFTTAKAQTLVHGFKLIEKRFVKEVNAECYYYEHVKSGAKLFKIANDDDNKSFSIAFNTAPSSDNGAPHIMEHSVLNGSTKFPVKSPFDVLSKGSLKTFLNAMTSKDATRYPIASMNEKDYFNLMNVYMDAVFHPLIFSDPRILKQEGWHYELLDKDQPVVYKGVVYNEMKGAYSTPTRELMYQMFKNLFPDTPYAYESGGYPTAIPTLTQQEFEAFHKKYYAPENSYIFLYGNADLDKELEFLDSEYLSKYTRAGVKIQWPDQKPFTAMKDITSYYPVMEGAPTEGQTYISMSWVAGSGTDGALSMALDMICDILVNQESGPIRLALQKEGIGKDVSAYCYSLKQNVVNITVQNAEPGDKQKFYDVVMNTLKDCISKGFDKKDIEGTLNRNEFYLREGADSQKGLTYGGRIQSGWFYDGNPFEGLEYEKVFTTLKQSLTTNYLEKIAGQYLVNNTHCLLQSLVPKVGMEQEITDKANADLAAYKKTLSSADIDKLIQDNKDLVAFQKREDTPEALATIPMLTLSDINPKATFYSCNDGKIGNIRTLYREDFANNIVYSNLYFNMNVLPQDMIPYASLLSNLLGMLDTEKYTYADLDREFNINTGGFSTYLSNVLPDQDDAKMQAYFVVYAKMMNDKTAKSFELTKETLLNTKYTDKDRIGSLLDRIQAQLDAQVKRDGSGIASRRLSSYFTQKGAFNELTDGLDYYWFVCDLVKQYKSNPDQVLANLKKTADLLFNANNMFCSVTCGKEDYANYSTQLSSFAKSLPANKVVTNTWTFKKAALNEGILTTSKVQYVIQGYDFKQLGYSWNGNMRVLNQIVSSDWLKNQVRVIGGAYGGYSTVSPNGVFTFNSYRDPNLQATINNYNGTVDYLKNFEASDTDMTRYIIGTISKIDVPATAPQKGQYAFNYVLTNTTQQMLQQEREQILATKVADIKGYAEMIQKILQQQNICVYGNTDKIKAEQSSLKSLITPDKK
jgi:Zn-dependent M16 (insulinase) family peptidase